MRKLGSRLLQKVLIAYWRRRDAPKPLPDADTVNPTDSIQRALNLVMPLADDTPLGRAYFVEAIAPAMQQIIAGLNNTGIVHFGRVTIADGNINLFTIYDGDFSNYVRDFIYNVGGAFNTIMEFVEDPPSLPVEDHPDEFVEWVQARDALQLPESPAALSDELEKVPRRLALLMDEHRDVQLFVYHAYPGYSAAQIRHALEIGW